MIKDIAQAIYDKKGFNIIALDVRNVCSMTDYFIIAEGSVDRHVQALCNEIRRKSDEFKIKLFHVDGEQGGDWIVMDCGQVVIHLFVPELRERYSLERLWHDGTIIDLELNHKE